MMAGNERKVLILFFDILLCTFRCNVKRKMKNLFGEIYETLNWILNLFIIVHLKVFANLKCLKIDCRKFMESSVG